MPKWHVSKGLEIRNHGARNVQFDQPKAHQRGEILNICLWHPNGHGWYSTNELQVFLHGASQPNGHLPRLVELNVGIEPALVQTELPGSLLKIRVIGDVTGHLDGFRHATVPSQCTVHRIHG